jgi:hypothetical protein
MKRIALHAFLAVGTCAPIHAAVQAPVLKWAYGGCFASYCQTGWYSSPAVVDLDNDGHADIVAGSYDVVALNSSDGSLKWRGASGDRVWPDIALGDLDHNGQPGIVVGRGDSHVTVYNYSGSVRLGFPAVAFASGEVRALALGDLDANGKLEVVVGVAAGMSAQTINVLAGNGDVRTGFPARHPSDPGYGWGIYNTNLAVGKLDADAYPDIAAPTDTHYITVLDRNGGQLRTHTMYGMSSDGNARKVWAEVGVHVDQVADLRGYAECGTEHRPNFALSAPAIADVDGDGTRELVVPGNVYDCSNETTLYFDVWVLRPDRTRWAAGSYDWTAIPPQGASGAPLSQDFNVIENIAANVVVADLDHDGRQEILLPSYDGKMHAWWLDKTEHGAWPFVIPGNGIHFASEPVVADLDNDGKAEVLFTTWAQTSNAESGRLYVLDSLGHSLFSVALPVARSPGASGGLAAPTLADVDGDGELEIVINTYGAGVLVYDLPGTRHARPLWFTGRGSYLRAGVALNDRIFSDGYGGNDG